MKNLHNEIMNIHVGTIQYEEFSSKLIAYKCGHRDARHTAAEMVNPYMSYIAELEYRLEDTMIIEEILKMREGYGL